MKVKISIPKDDPQVTVEVDPEVIIKAFKEILEKLPFKVELKGEKGGEHKPGHTL